MADIASLIKALKDTAVAQYGKGAPYREALASALKGDMSGVNQALSKSELTPMDFALMMGVNGVGGKMHKTQFEMAHELAQQRASLPISEGGLGLHPENTAMDRANAMGYTNPAYHATNNDVKNFIPSDVGTYGPGVYSAKHPEVAEGYYQDFNNSNTIPLLINKGKEKQFQSFSDYVNQKGKERNTFNYGNDLRNEGYNSLNVKFFPEGEVREYNNFNPSDVRSRFAAFDPFRRNEADILAGVGAGLPLVDYNKKK